MILGIEAFLPLADAMTFGMDKIGVLCDDYIVSICNWALAANPKHIFFKNLIVDIITNPISNNVLLNTGPGRITKHAINYFGTNNIIKLKDSDIVKESSILYNINKFGSNQSHSNSIKNYQDELIIDRDDVYIIHKFEGSWRNNKNKKISILNSKYGVSHNLTIIKSHDGYLGVARYDEDTSRTKFMQTIGDCRTLIEYRFDNNLNLINETIKPIKNYNQKAKFEDYRQFIYLDKLYYSVSYLDEQFNTRVAILDSEYNFLGDVKITNYNKVAWNNSAVTWEKNWLFFCDGEDLFFIYSTTPRYIVYKCENFDDLYFAKHIDIEWQLKNNIPQNEEYFTSYIGSEIKIASGGSSNPIYLKEYNLYLYFIHTKIYNERKYNHYAVLLNKQLMPIFLLPEPIIKKYLDYPLLFVSSVVETDDYFIFNGGVDDKSIFIWELSKYQILKKLKL